MKYHHIHYSLAENKAMTHIQRSELHMSPSIHFNQFWTQPRRSGKHLQQERLHNGLWRRLQQCGPDLVSMQPTAAAGLLQVSSPVHTAAVHDNVSHSRVMPLLKGAFIHASYLKGSLKSPRHLLDFRKGWWNVKLSHLLIKTLRKILYF